MQVERLKHLEATYWWKWPEWLCKFLTNHRLSKRWGRYDIDVAGSSCHCGWYIQNDD